MDPVHRLRRAKLRATLLLVLAAGIYVTTRVVSGGDSGVLGFVQAGADAGMVGGLADWFAVTALFKHPLGLRIPHTALVRRQKVELATKLGEFVTDNFLTADLLRDQVTSRDLVGATGRWLAQPANADRMARETAVLLSAGIDALDAGNLADYVLELVRKDAHRRSYAPVAGGLLRRALAGGVQRPLVDLLVSRGHDYLLDHQLDATRLLRDLLQRQGFLVRTFANEDKLVRAVTEILGEVRADPAHPLRGQLDGLLSTYADDLETNYELAARLNSAVLQLLADPSVVSVFVELVQDGMDSVRTSLAGDHTDIQDRLAALLRDLGTRASTDTEFRARVEHGVLEVVDVLAKNYGQEVVALIRGQVESWDDEQVSERIELAVGRDLQFIRINGTAVGALAGIAIHAVGVAL